MEEPKNPNFLILCGSTRYTFLELQNKSKYVVLFDGFHASFLRAPLAPPRDAERSLPANGKHGGHTFQKYHPNNRTTKPLQKWLTFLTSKTKGRPRPSIRTSMSCHASCPLMGAWIRANKKGLGMWNQTESSKVSRYKLAYLWHNHK